MELAMCGAAHTQAKRIPTHIPQLQILREPRLPFRKSAIPPSLEL